MPVDALSHDQVADSILVGVGVLMCSVVLLSIASGITVSVSASLSRRTFAGGGFVQNVTVLMITVLIALTAIMAQVALWACVLNNLDQFPSYTDAFYCSANNFTALGLDRIEVRGRWRLLGPLEAMNGAIMFGVTTAIVFTIMNRLAALRAARAVKEQHDAEHPTAKSPSADDRGTSPPTIGSRSWFL